MLAFLVIFSSAALIMSFAFGEMSPNEANVNPTTPAVKRPVPCVLHHVHLVMAGSIVSTHSTY